MKRRRPPLPLVGRLLEPAYRAAVAHRNARFDLGERVERVGCPIISVGNLSVGGTGKTPMVRAIVGWLAEAGYAPFIAMRGYASRPGERSDEQAEHMDALPGVAVLAAPDRVRAIRAHLGAGATRGSVCVLDDGFQHRFVARDLDIALVDATRDPFEDRCVPAGWLREPVEALARAGAVVVTRADMVPAGAADRLSRAVRAVAPSAFIATSRHVWAELLDDSAGSHTVSWLHGRTVALACSIGNPEAFVEQARRSGCSVAFEIVRRDHARWTERDATKLLERAGRAGCACALVTEKDWATLGPVAGALRARGVAGPPVVRPRVAIELLTGGPRLRELVLRAASGHAPPSGGAGEV